MLKISKKLEYALIALRFCASKGPNDLTSTREICEQFSTPFDTTAKVMQIMNNCGLLSSTQGIKGGYYLAQELSQITFVQLAEIIDQRPPAQVCLRSKDLCEQYKKCNIVAPMQQLIDKVHSFLDQLTLAEIFNENGIGK